MFALFIVHLVYIVYYTVYIEVDRIGIKSKTNFYFKLLFTL